MHDKSSQRQIKSSNYVQSSFRSTLKMLHTEVSDSLSVAPLDGQERKIIQALLE